MKFSFVSSLRQSQILFFSQILERKQYFYNNMQIHNHNTNTNKN